MEVGIQPVANPKSKEVELRLVTAVLEISLPDCVPCDPRALHVVFPLSLPVILVASFMV